MMVNGPHVVKLRPICFRARPWRLTGGFFLYRRGSRLGPLAASRTAAILADCQGMPAGGEGPGSAATARETAFQERPPVLAVWGRLAPFWRAGGRSRRPQPLGVQFQRLRKGAALIQQPGGGI